MWQFGTSAFNAVVWRRKLGEVENECTLHNSSPFDIYLPKKFKIGKNFNIGDNLTKFLQKQFCTVFETRYAVSQKIVQNCGSKKVPTLKLSLTSSNLKQFSFLAILENAWNLLQNTYDIVHLTLGMLPHYLGKLKIPIFCRYLADMAEIQTKCILIASNFVIHPQILIFSALKMASGSPYWLQIKFLSKSCSRR